ncbi:MAG: HAD family hydrolase [Candidatus Geothermincolia bacterium]
MGAEKGRCIAFFDLDHTLLDGSSSNKIVKYMLGQKLVGLPTIWKALKYTVLYELNILPYEDVYMWSFRLSAEQPIDELTAMLDRAYESLIFERFYDEGRRRIAEHRERGDLTVICTAVGEYMAEKARVQLGADDKIAAMARIRDGRLTDEIARPLPYAQGKVELARRLADSHGARLADCWFYSDSASDLPLLEAVGHPVLVNPQLKLRRIAKGRGWPLERWNGYASFEGPSVPERLSWRV